MRITLFWILLLAGTAGNAQKSWRDYEEQGRILALESAWNQAVQQRDAKAVEPLLDDELIYVDDDGTIMNKARYLANVRSPAAQLQRVVNESLQVRFFENSAVVIGVYREQGLRNGKPYLLRDRFVDTWIDRNGAWMCVASQSTPIAH
jgi:hypothetical protein